MCIKSLVAILTSLVTRLNDNVIILCYSSFVNYLNYIHTHLVESNNLKQINIF